MSNLPKFNLLSIDLTANQLSEELNKDRPAWTKFFQAGLHNVKIISVIYKGQSKKDESWSNFEVNLEGTMERKTKAYLMLPTARAEYITADGKGGTKKSLFPLKLAIDFFRSLGIDAQPNTLGNVINTYIDDQGCRKLIDKTLMVKMGYDGNHVKYIGKSSEGLSQYAIVKKDGTTQLTDTPEFESFSDAKKYAQDNNIDLEGFVNVLEFLPGEVIATQEDAGW